MPTQFDFNSQSAIVTGGAQGIGRAIAERLADSGANIAIWDSDEDRANTTARELQDRGRVIAITVDVTNPEAVEAARDQTLSAFETVEVLVNNAGIAGPNQTSWDYDIDAWKHVLDINLNGPFYCCRAIVPHMMERGYGRIVNIASIAGKEGNPNASAYSASKAGLIALTKSLGKELAEFDISVNCLTPAAAKTAIFDQITQEHIDYMLAKIPRGRFVRVEEIAAMAAFAASRECSFTTGSVFDISGGRATY